MLRHTYYPGYFVDRSRRIAKFRAVPSRVSETFSQKENKTGLEVRLWW
jgi:hypothetical protein